MKPDVVASLLLLLPLIVIAAGIAAYSLAKNGALHRRYLEWSNTVPTGEPACINSGKDRRIV